MHSLSFQPGFREESHGSAKNLHPSGEYKLEKKLQVTE
jgi:hypothetical protein